MKALVVYDSGFGNTEEIARAVGRGIGGDTEVVRSAEADAGRLEGLDLLVIGSPTRAGRPMPATQKFLKEAGPAVKGMKVAAFDTRIPSRVVKIIGYAAGRIAESLEKSGGKLISPAEPFVVTGVQGPLKEGELERAEEWGKKLAG